MKVRFYPLIIFILILACFSTHAEEPVFETKNKPMDLEEVVVTATRTERTTEEIPAGVSVVTKEKIKDTRMFNLKDALTGIPGVQAESKNGGMIPV